MLTNVKVGDILGLYENTTITETTLCYEVLEMVSPTRVKLKNLHTKHIHERVDLYLFASIVKPLKINWRRLIESGTG